MLCFQFAVSCYGQPEQITEEHDSNPWHSWVRNVEIDSMENIIALMIQWIELGVKFWKEWQKVIEYCYTSSQAGDKLLSVRNNDCQDNHGYTQ